MGESLILWLVERRFGCQNLGEALRERLRRRLDGSRNDLSCLQSVIPRNSRDFFSQNSRVTGSGAEPEENITSNYPV